MRSSCLRCCGISAAQPRRAAGQRGVCAGGPETAASASRGFSFKIVFASGCFILWGEGTRVWDGEAKPPGDQVGPGAPVPAQRRARELRDGGTRAGHGRAGLPPKLTPGRGFVSYALHPRCAYVCGYGCTFISVRTGLVSPGKQQPSGCPFGDRCLSRTPRAWLPDAATAATAAPGRGAVRQGVERGERGAEPRPDAATVSGTVGILFPTLPSRLRHLVGCMRLSLSLFPFPLVSPRSSRERMQEASGTSYCCMP